MGFSEFDLEAMKRFLNGIDFMANFPTRKKSIADFKIKFSLSGCFVTFNDCRPADALAFGDQQRISAPWIDMETSEHNENN